MLIEYQCHNTVLHTQYRYVLNGKGHPVLVADDAANLEDTEAVFEFEAYLYAPPMLLPITWKRYGYHETDVRQTLKESECYVILQLMLMLMVGQYEPDATSSVVRSSFQSLFSLLFVSKQKMYHDYAEAHRDFFRTQGDTVLMTARPDHHPMLPVVRVVDETFGLARHLVPKRRPSFRYMVTYPRSFSFQGIELVPVEFDEALQLVYMVRVIPADVFLSIPVLPKLCAVTAPSVVRIRRTVSKGPNGASSPGDEASTHGEFSRYILMEEACFFAADMTPPVMAKVDRELVVAPTPCPAHKRKVRVKPRS